jgi:hypothetical protein
MHPFDHSLQTETIVGDLNQYAEHIDQNYLSVCNNKTILEIACGTGTISKRIVNHSPQKFTMVDPGHKISPIEETSQIQFISEDINHWLSQPRPSDVVICCGFLYHLHSPLHLLELIVNYCNPETIILDNVVAPHPLAFNQETHNVPGNRFVEKEWKHCPYNMPTPFFVINQSLDHMGYVLVKSHHLRCDPFPKSNSWVASWIKKR